MAERKWPPAPELRIAELEAELAATKKTVDALLDKAEQREAAIASSRALVESERQLWRKNAELKRLNEMKGDFISIAAHELRTPLTSVVGYLDLMAEGRFGQMPSEIERPIASVRRNAHRLMRLVDDMLDVSRIEAGNIALHRVRSDL